MPKRENTKEEAVAPVAQTARAPRTPKAEPVAEAPAGTGTAPATTKKLPLTEKVKKWIAGINQGVADNIYEIIERVVEDEDKQKNNVCFITFTDPQAEEVDDIVNEHSIKEILFGYHTIPEKTPSGKQIIVEVLTPEEGADEPYILVVQEV